LKISLFFRFLNVGIQLDHTLRLEEPRELKHQPEQIIVILPLPPRALYDLYHPFGRVLDDRHGIRDHESTDRAAADHHSLKGKGVENDVEIASREDEPAENEAGYHQKPKNQRHAQLLIMIIYSCHICKFAPKSSIKASIV
jgi:hypothetical protein